MCIWYHLSYIICHVSSFGAGVADQNLKFMVLEDMFSFYNLVNEHTHDYHILPCCRYGVQIHPIICYVDLQHTIPRMKSSAASYINLQFVGQAP